MCKKRQSSQQCCLALLGPMSVKATRKMLMKLSPDWCDCAARGIIKNVEIMQ